MQAGYDSATLDENASQNISYVTNMCVHDAVPVYETARRPEKPNIDTSYFWKKYVLTSPASASRFGVLTSPGSGTYNFIQNTFKKTIYMCYPDAVPVNGTP
jgi:hypothetical protein